MFNNVSKHIYVNELSQDWHTQYVCIHIRVFAAHLETTSPYRGIPHTHDFSGMT